MPDTVLTAAIHTVISQPTVALMRNEMGIGAATLSGTNTGDNAANTLYSGLVTNALHSGDAVGSTALTVRGVNGVLMSGLATGIVKNTTGTGAPSIAVAGDFPTFNQDTTGYASALKSATTTVDVAAATAPSVGQVLIATSDSTATWQTLVAGGSGTVTTVSVAAANGFTGTVTNAGTTPAITIVPGNITPTAVTCTGVIAAAGGTEALPAFTSTTGTPDTGVFFPAANIMAFTTNATEKARMIASGYLGLGIATPLAPLHVGNRNVNNSVDAVILTSRLVDDSVVGNGHGFSDSSYISRSGTIGYNSYDARVSFEGISAFDHYTAFQHLPTFSSIATTSDVYGFYGRVNITDGAITNNYGVFLENAIGGGAVANNYGIYIADQTKGVTSNHAIYVVGGKTYLGGDVAVSKTVTPALTVGAQTISKNAGAVNFAAGATTLTVTNTRVTANSIIMCSIGTVDATFTSVKAVVAGSGSFVIHANAAATAETRVNFLVIN